MEGYGFFCSATPPPPLVGFVPYIGATANVDLGANNLTVKDILMTNAAGVNTQLTINSPTGLFPVISLQENLSQNWAIYNNTAVAGKPLVFYDATSASNMMNLNNGKLTVTNNNTTDTLNLINTGTLINQYPTVRLSGTSSKELSIFVTNANHATLPNLSGLYTNSTNGFSITDGTNNYFSVIPSSGLTRIGNSVSTNQRQVRIGQDTAFVDIGSLVGSTSNGAIFFNQNTPSISNSAMYGNATGTVLNATGSVSMSLSITPIITVSSVGTTTINPVSSSSGAVTGLTFTAAANTNQTLGTNIPNFRVTGANKQWATGTVPLQYFTHLTANTVSAVGASTFTNVYGLYVEAATAGTNATITNNYAAGFSGRVGQYGLGNSTYFGDLCGVKDDLASRQNTAFGFSAANKVAGGSLNVSIGSLSLFSNVSGNNNVAIGGLTLYQATSNSNIAVGGYALYNLTNGQSNVAIGYDTGGGVTTGGNNVFIGNGITGLASSLSNNIILATNLGVERFRYNPSQGSASLFSFSPASTTGNVSSTEINILRVNAATTTLSTGALTTQRFTYLPSQTLAFAGASTINNSYGIYVEAATAGTNATITNNYAAGFDGRVILTSATGGRIDFVATNSYVANTGGNMRILGSEVFIDAGGATATIRTTNTLWQWGAGLNMSFGTGIGSKIGTATNQLFSFWNATPIVQPTTGVSAATLVSNAGTALTSTDTFDGYTLQQIVKALRNTGLLA